MKVKVHTYIGPRSLVTVRKLSLSPKMYLDLLSKVKALNSNLELLSSMYKDLEDDTSSYVKECRYYYYFIDHKGLEDEYHYFKKYAHEVQDPDEPFSSLVL